MKYLKKNERRVICPLKVNKFNKFVKESYDLEKIKESAKNIGLDLTNKISKIDLTKYGKDIKENINTEEISPEELKKRAENVGLDLTKNLSKKIEL